MVHSKHVGIAVCLCLFTLTSKASTVRFRVPEPPQTLDWNLAHSSTEAYVLTNLMQGLYEYSESLEPIPVLAEKSEISANGKIYRITLKDGVLWSDGVKLKARHFLDSWMRLLDPKTKAPYASLLFSVLNAKKYERGQLRNPKEVGIKILNDLEIEVTLEKPDPLFLHDFTFWGTFPIRLDARERSPGPTLGPYLIESHSVGKKLVMVKNPKYFAKSLFDQSPDKVEILFERDNTKAWKSFEQGSIDFFINPRSSDLMRFLTKHAGASDQILRFPYLSTHYLGFNFNSQMGKNENLRRALALSIFQKNIPAELQGGQVEAGHLIPPALLKKWGMGIEPFQVSNLYEARSYLAKAGFLDGRGLPKLKIVIEPFDGSDILFRFLKNSIQKSLGLDLLQIEAATFGEYEKICKSGKFDLVVGHWGADFPEPSNFLEILHSKSPANRLGFNDSTYDRIVDELQTEVNFDVRKIKFTEAERLILEKSVALVPLFHTQNTIVKSSQVRKIEISPLNYFFFKRLSI